MMPERYTCSKMGTPQQECSETDEQDVALTEQNKETFVLCFLCCEEPCYKDDTALSKIYKS
jgi:hypothetical protein